MSSKATGNVAMLDSYQLRGRGRTLQPHGNIDHRGQLETMLQLEYILYNGIIGNVLEIHQYAQIYHVFSKDQNVSDSGSTRLLAPILDLTSEIKFSRDLDP